jgi:hypothetical protein
VTRKRSRAEKPLLQKTCQLDTASVLSDHASLLAGGLARPAEMANFHAIAALLPKFCQAGFECPLGDDEPGLDFLHCLRRTEESRYLVEAPVAHVVWRRLKHFGTLWRNGADALDRIPNCCLEFDLRNQPATDVPAPSLFVNVPATDPAEYDATLEHVGSALQIARNSATRAAMIRMYEVFGSLSSACETGFWLSRRTPAIRMVLMKIQASPDGVIDLLARAGHPDPSIVRRAPVPALWPIAGSISIGVDVTEETSPGCSVELYPLPPDRAFPEEVQAEAQRRLLEDVVAAGLCTANKNARVMSWPGSVCHGDDPDLHAQIWLRRAIHHIKLSIKPEQPVSAKAYLSLSGLAAKQEWMAHASA